MFFVLPETKKSQSGWLKLLFALPFHPHCQVVSFYLSEKQCQVQKK